MLTYLSLSTVACNTCRMNWNEEKKRSLATPMHCTFENLGCDVTPLVQRMNICMYWNSAISWICTTKATSTNEWKKKCESKRSQLLIYRHYFRFEQECRRQSNKKCCCCCANIVGCFHREFECGRCIFSWDSMSRPPFLFIYFFVEKTVWLALHRHTIHIHMSCIWIPTLAISIICLLFTFYCTRFHVLVCCTFSVSSSVRCVHSVYFSIIILCLII